MATYKQRERALHEVLQHTLHAYREEQFDGVGILFKTESLAL